MPNTLGGWQIGREGSGVVAPVGVYLEVGSKLTHAIVPHWPGWSRAGRDEASALQTLLDFGPRYASAIESQGLAFTVPSSVDDLQVVDRLTGNATSDFGVPGLSLPGDAAPMDPGELERSEMILVSCWRALDRAVDAARGKTLRLGPRGGGRSLEQVVSHVREVESSYAGATGVKLGAGLDPAEAREAIVSGLRAVVAGEIPATGPRGGKRWTPRYFVRRLAWHELYHAWVTEDRIL
jgi:hypothetical protein